VPTTASISDVQSTEVWPGALSAPTHSLNPAAAGLDDVTLLVAAAERLAQTQMSPWVGTRPGGRVVDSAFCTQCQRHQTIAGMKHAESCPVGPVLDLCAKLADVSGMSLAQAEFARGVAHGEARQLARQLDAIAVPPSEQASAVRTLELVTGTGITLTPERAAQIQREFENAARRPEEPPAITRSQRHVIAEMVPKWEAGMDEVVDALTRCPSEFCQHEKRVQKIPAAVYT
jgi:hypothetical protein